MKLLVGQTGAPTAVVNRSLWSFVATVATQAELLGCHGGPNGLVCGDWTAMSADFPRDAPGSVLGGGRRRMASEDIALIVENCSRQEVDGMALVGGNGTMSLLEAIQAEAQRRDVDLRVVGIPKTIDNDLAGVDAAPGYASAASFVARTVSAMGRDHAAMRSIEPVRIVETMGRSVGWLALAGTYPIDPGFQADLVLIPELGWDQDAFLEQVSDVLTRRGRVLIVVSEGVAPELTKAPVDAANHTTLITGGLSRVLADLVQDRLNLPARGEILGTAQRSATWAVSRYDADIAARSAQHAAQLLITGDQSGVMATPTGESVALSDVGGLVRSVPDHWRTTDPTHLSEFHDWLKPLIQPLIEEN